MSALDVLLESTRVGRLESFDEWQHRFSFDTTWLTNPARPVLGQIFENLAPRDLESTGTLPCWFDHLLPPSGSPLRHTVSQQIGVEDDDDFALLEFLGSDLPGAVMLIPCAPGPAPEPPTPTRSAVERTLLFSLAGMQWKLSLREQNGKLALPLRGETGSVIAKFPNNTYQDLPRVEMATMLWAKRSGIEVPPIRLAQTSDIENLPDGIPVGDGTIYVIERFDRRPGGVRIHIEDFGQVLDRPADQDQIYKARYEHLAAFLSYLPGDDLRAFCERLVFCILSGNTDAHVKNWSIIYPDGRHPRLAPAYDLVSTILYETSPKADLALTLNNSRRFEDVSLQSFLPLATVTRVPFDEVSTWVREMVERVLTAWHEGAGELPYLPNERERIEAHIARIPLASERSPGVPAT